MTFLEHVNMSVSNVDQTGLDVADQCRGMITVRSNLICAESADALHCHGLGVGTPLASSVEHEAQRVILAA